MKQHTVGIDISKAHLDAHRLADGHSAQFDNDPAGFRALIDWIGTPVECVAYEATGPYHRDLEEALSKAKLPLAKVNPWQARRFAEATGSRAKTDAVDARKLAQMAASLDPRRTPAPSKTQRRLQDLQSARDALIRQRTAALNRRRQLREPFLKQQNQTRINMFERHLRALDRKLQTLIAADEARARKLEILTSIPGIAAALRWNPDLAEVYRRLRERGKPGKVTLVAVMRKLIVLANTLVRQDRTWLPVAPRATF